MAKNPARHLTCDHCQKRVSSVLVSQKLNPRNLQPHTMRLCTPCRTRLGYTAHRYHRGKHRLPGAEA